MQFDRNKRLVIGGGVAALAVVLAVAAFAIFGRGTDGAGNILARLGQSLTSLSQSFTSPSPGASGGDFAFRRLEIDTTKNQAEACLVFTRPLDVSGRIHYEDYLSVDPQTRFAARAVDTRLCLAGFEFNKTYSVTLRSGFPSADGRKLAGDETVPVELRDKPSLVRFSGGIILPRETSGGVPVTTVNVARLTLKIVRVGDRLLSQLETGAVDQTTLYSWDAQQLQNNQGSVVWQGEMNVANTRNESVVTLIPVRDMLKGKKPGAYVLIAGDAAKKAGTEDSPEQMASQWVVVSDLSLTSFTGANGLSIFVRSYATARPLSGIKLTLVARDNNELASVTTNKDGRADFAPGLMRATGGDEPVVVMAYGPGGSGGDFSFLDLRRGAFDLTDRGVEGRAAPGPVDAYVYTERGVYRPGESVKAVAMLRDVAGTAITTAPLTLIAQRPDGLEAGRTTIAATALAAGAGAWTLPLSPTAPHGRWQIAAYVDPKGDAVGRVQFDVADFVPQRLRVNLTAQERAITPGADFHVRVFSQFLYGAPASGLSGEGQARVTANPEPFAAWRGYQFGRMDDSFSDVNVDLKVPDTDAGGNAVATGNLAELADTTLPLKAAVKISIHEPGGRVTDKSLDLPILTRNVLIGLRPLFEGGSVAENAAAGFDAIAVDATGRRIALPGVTLSWVREDTSYQWYQDNGEWKYRAVTRDRLITSNTMALGAGNPARLSQAMPYGTYRLTLTDAKSGASTSYRFYSGWSASAAGDRPDRIPVAADKPNYRTGETARIRIKPEAAGKALVVVAGDRVYSSQMIDVPASGATVSVPVDAAWGAGAYVLVTHYRPLAEASGREPVRSIGVAWLAIDNSPRTIGVALATPARITPRRRLTVPLTLTNLARGEDTYVTLAAVDEGILQLTDYASPDPTRYYYGKRRLGVMMRDDYGRLIKPEKGPIGILEQGGDGFGGRPLAVVPTRTVALFSGIVTVGADGKASVALDIPDFNGALRLMAVAFSKSRLGHAEKPLIVRDPVVAEIVLPRFLAPGDHAMAALNMNNVEGAAGAYQVTVRATGPLTLANGQRQVQITQTLAARQRVLVPVEVIGQNLGIGGVFLTVTGPNFRVARDWPLQVRAAQLDVARDETLPLNAGASYTANRSVASDLIGSTTQVALTVSATHGFSDVGGLLKWLDKYPFGCLEQLTSRAAPLLYFNDMADLANLPRDNRLRARVQAAIDSILDMQNYAGDFGMWGPGGNADAFVSAYALDFLHQAREKNYVVPNDALTRGDNWLRQTAGSDSNDDATRAYAFYVLARAGQANVSDLRYFADTRMNEMKTAIAPAMTGAAAQQVGDRSRAVAGFTRARVLIRQSRAGAYAGDTYGSALRDLAATLALAAETGQNDIVPELMRAAQNMDMRLNVTTTQEKGWMLRAAYALTRQRMPLNILVNNQPAQARDNAVRLTPSLDQLNAGITLANRGDATVWRTTSVQGTPNAALPPAANGVTLAKSVWTMSGTPADTNAMKQNDRVIVELSGRFDANIYRQVGVIDLLPAGWEIEAPVSPGDAKLYPFLGTITDTSMSDARDDKYVAAFTVGSRYRPAANDNKPEPQPEYRLAYIARAVTPGRFALPAGAVMDMYAPAIMARSAMGSASVSQ